MLQRIKNDFYPTKQAKQLIQVLRNNVDIKGKILEPFAGMGDISSQFSDVITVDKYRYKGFTPTYYANSLTPIIYEKIRMNYPEGFNWVITNPPFKDAAIALPLCFKYANRGVAFLIRLNYIEPAKNRGEWLEQNDCFNSHIIILNPRPKFRSDTNNSDEVTVVWMVYDKLHIGETKLIYARNWNKIK